MGTMILLRGCGMSIHDPMPTGWLANLEGASRDRAFSVPCVPDGRFEIDGNTMAYVRHNRESASRLMALPNTAYGMHGQTSFQVADNKHTCTVKIIKQHDIAKLGDTTEMKMPANHARKDCVPHRTSAFLLFR